MDITEVPTWTQRPSCWKHEEADFNISKGKQQWQPQGWWTCQWEKRKVGKNNISLSHLPFIWAVRERCHPYLRWVILLQTVWSRKLLTGVSTALPFTWFQIQPRRAFIDTYQSWCHMLVHLEILPIHIMIYYYDLSNQRVFPFSRSGHWQIASRDREALEGPENLVKNTWKKEISSKRGHGLPRTGNLSRMCSCLFPVNRSLLPCKTRQSDTSLAHPSKWKQKTKTPA